MLPDEFILEPDEGYFSSYRFLHQYHKQVRDILLKEAADEPLARMVELPSFSPEYAVALEDRKEGIRLIRYETSEPIWNNKNPDQVKVAMLQAEIDKETSGVIHEVFFSAVSRSRYADDSPSGLDGAFYHFSAYRQNFGLRGGQVWSPDQHTLADALVNYALGMNEYVDANGEEKEALKSRLRSGGHALLARLANARTENLPQG
jgi:hypothetical protein